MITAIRQVRRAKGLTLQQVADRCDPPTTAQTIGRLETGTRTVSVGWLNRIAAALGVTAAELVTLPERADVGVAALIGPDGAHAPRQPAVSLAPQPDAALVAVHVEAGVGEWRTGDALWCERLPPNRFAAARNRDALVPRPAGRFAFGRVLDLDGERLHLLPAGAGARQMVIAAPPWIAVVRTLIRQV